MQISSSEWIYGKIRQSDPLGGLLPWMLHILGSKHPTHIPRKGGLERWQKRQNQVSGVGSPFCSSTWPSGSFSLFGSSSSSCSSFSFHSGSSRSAIIKRVDSYEINLITGPWRHLTFLVIFYYFKIKFWISWFYFFLF